MARAMAAAPSFLQGTAYDQRSRDRARAPERAPFASALTPGAVLATAVLYAALTAWFLWPLPTAASSHLLYPTSSWELIDADADFALWAMAWTAHALVTDPLHLFDANVFYPMPRALALSDHMVGHQPVFAPVFLATGNPVLAGNVLLLFDFWLAAMGTFLLATRFMPASAAVVAGAAFGFVASRRANTFHLHVLAVGWMSLAMFFADRWLERARWRDGAPMAVAPPVRGSIMSSVLCTATVSFEYEYSHVSPGRACICSTFPASLAPKPSQPPSVTSASASTGCARGEIAMDGPPGVGWSDRLGL